MPPKITLRQPPSFFRYLSKYLVAALLVMLPSGFFSSVHAVSGALHLVGRWSGPFTFHPDGDQVVHMVVMRDAEDSLGVLYWGAAASARLWMSGSLDTTFSSLPVPNQITEEFCSGHSGLDDGRVLISGGSLRERGETGLKHANIFDLSRIDFSQPPDSANPTNRGWVRQRNMANWRWYPTNTTLGDGKVLVSSGMRFSYTTVFGGRIGGALVDTLQAFAQHETVFVVTPSAGTGPTAREGHTAIYDDKLGRMVVFGGYDGTYRNDLRPLIRSYGSNGEAETWSWQTALSPSNPPPARSRHSAVFVPSDTSMVIFGGESG